jgi:hypothetical protein
MFATKRVRLAALALAAAVLGVGATIAATTADASPAQHNPPPKLEKLNLSGFVFDADYTLGVNTGNTFQQVYTSTTAQGTPIAGPNVGVKFPVDAYTAMALPGGEVYIAWQDPTTALLDVFVLDFKNHAVYDYAPGSAKPGSVGSLKVVHWPTAGLPR